MNSFVPIAALAAFIALPAAAQDIDRGERLFERNCSVCHGADGTGGGPMAEVLTVVPADLTRIAARRDGGFPVIEVARIIDGRAPLMSHGGEMPIFGFVFGSYDAILREEGVGTLLTAQEVVDIVGWLERVQETD